MVETAKPTLQQLSWQDMELGMFCHYGLNTFHNQEWGSGNDPAKSFYPSALDAGQWVSIAKQAGFKYFILTAKHHDGFCLWQTNTTDYSVKSSPWKNGKGDVVAECAEACRKEGIRFGIYLSPWDRHEPCYNVKEQYDQFYIRQLTELLTGYGPIVEVWLDGAGSEGRDYDWLGITSTIKKYQPDAMIFNMGCPTVRWVGNEEGAAPYPCWNTAKEARVSMFANDMLTWLPDTPLWVPAECDVPIRKRHWFWHPDDEGSLCTLDELMDIYYRSVGRGANLLLNVASDNRGLIPDVDAQRVIEFGNEIKKRFSNPLAETSDHGHQVELELPSQCEIDHVILMEDIAHGERVREYVLEAEQNGEWVELVRGSAVGHKKIDTFGIVTTSKLRLNVLSSDDMPLIRKMSAFSTV